MIKDLFMFQYELSTEYRNTMAIITRVWRIKCEMENGMEINIYDYFIIYIDSISSIDMATV